MSDNKLIREVGDSDFTYPSPIVAFNLQVEGNNIEVKIPKDELARVKEIFQGHDYSILPQRRFSGSRVIVDVGANVGIFSIYMKMNYPNSQIYCFEPVPSTIELLRQNLRLVPDSFIFPFGLSNENRKEKIQIHATNSGANSIKINEKNQGNYTTTVDIELKDAAEFIDNLKLKDINILKIDTEGCEVEILKSIESKLINVDYVLAEYHSESDRREIDQLLKDFCMFSSKSIMVNFGLVKYVNSKLI